MPNVTYKAQALARELNDRLKMRFPTLANVETVAADGNPLLKIGALANGGVNFIIKVSHLDFPLAQDSLGNTAQHYALHKIQIATEANNAAGAAADILTAQQILDCFGPAMFMGAQVEWWNSANGAAPSESTFATGSNLKATFKDLYWPLAMA